MKIISEPKNYKPYEKTQKDPYSACQRHLSARAGRRGLAYDIYDLRQQYGKEGANAKGRH